MAIPLRVACLFSIRPPSRKSIEHVGINLNSAEFEGKVPKIDQLSTDFFERFRSMLSVPGIETRFHPVLVEALKCDAMVLARYLVETEPSEYRRQLDLNAIVDLVKSAADNLPPYPAYDRVDPRSARTFYGIMQQVQLNRQRNGAYGWSIARDIANSELWTERYHCPTWYDYLRQRRRPTQYERALQKSAAAFTSAPSLSASVGCWSGPSARCAGKKRAPIASLQI